MKRYEITRDPLGMVVCLVHQESKKLVYPLVPSKWVAHQYRLLSNGNLELCLCILADYFEEKDIGNLARFQKACPKAVKYCNQFYKDKLRNKAVPTKLGFLSEKQINRWYLKQKLKEVEEKMDGWMS